MFKAVISVLSFEAEVPSLALLFVWPILKGLGGVKDPPTLAGFAVCLAYSLLRGSVV